MTRIPTQSELSLLPNASATPASDRPAPQSAGPAPASMRLTPGTYSLDADGTYQVRLGAGRNGEAAKITTALVPRDGFWDAVAGLAPGAVEARTSNVVQATAIEPRHHAVLGVLAAGCLLGALLVSQLGHAGERAASAFPFLFALGLAAPIFRGDAHPVQPWLVAAALVCAAPYPWVGLVDAPQPGAHSLATSLFGQLAAASAVRALGDLYAPTPAASVPRVPAISMQPPVELIRNVRDAKGVVTSSATLSVAEVKLADAGGTMTVRGELRAAVWGAAPSVLALDSLPMLGLAHLAQSPLLNSLVKRAMLDYQSMAREFSPLIEPAALRRYLEHQFDLWSAAPAAPEPLLSPRAAFNLALDRTRINVQLPLYPGVHTVAGLGLEAGLSAAAKVHVHVAPGTTAKVTTSRVDQEPGEMGKQPGWCSSLGAAIGALFAAIANFVRASVNRLLGRTIPSPSPSASAPAAAGFDVPRATRQEAPLYAHGLQMRLSRPVTATLGNFTKHFVSVHIGGANVDEEGGLRPHGSVRLFGLPVLNLNANWVRNALLDAGVRLTLDPYRLLFEGDVFAAPAPNAPPVPVLDSATQASRAAAAMGLMGEILGPIDVDVVRTDLQAPRLVLSQTLSGAPGEADETYRLRLFATNRAFQVRYDLKRFAEPIEATVRNLQFEGDVQRFGAGARGTTPWMQLNVPHLEVHGFWPDAAAATVWQHGAAPRVTLAQGGGAMVRPLLNLTDLSLTRTPEAGRLTATLNLPQQHKHLAVDLLKNLGGPAANSLMKLALQASEGFDLDASTTRLALATPFHPGPPPVPAAAAPVPPAAAPPAPGAPAAKPAPAPTSESGESDALDGSTLVGTPAPSRPTSGRSTPTTTFGRGDVDDLVGTAQVKLTSATRRSSASSAASFTTLVGSQPEP